ncbi:MAG: isoleucine--tRNA ligase [Gemmatimonadota bacterium]
MNFPEFPPDARGLEEALLEQWRSEELFYKTLEATRAGEPFVFWEGPPTANGRPGLHHVFSRTLKDVVCRFRAAQGRQVTRIAGWDTHGLPVEIEAEKKLGVSGKRAIEELGVAAFNKACRDSVFTYKEDWERLSERIAYWLDYRRPYVTFSHDYIESVWSLLAELHGNGFLYRGHKSVPYCPRCGTVLSSHEVALGYEDVADPSLYFTAPLLDADGSPDPEGRAFVVWTTTPWTLPANAALAVHPDLAYAEVRHGDARLLLAEERVQALFGEEAEVVRRWPASELIGRRYDRPFDLLADDGESEAAWTVVAEDFVSADDGSGLVHIAPAFGADDYASGQRHGLPMLRPIDDAGRFEEGVRMVGGAFVKDADEPLLEDLRARGRVFRYSLEEHTYPHCWRCSTPLLYMARDSWFLETTRVRDDMVAHNEAVNWYPPEVGTGRFGEWLSGNVDWALSRDRYWGTPLPVWVCDADEGHVEVIGSYAALAERAGPLGDDFDPHKPGIDALQWGCARCAGVMRRVPEVIDVWFDSGAMPYAQWHWPHENDADFEAHFPADYICEGIDQTRGWFYSLMAIATMLGRGPAYRNVIVNGLLLDADGQKMSKSKGNVVDPWDPIGEYGADAVRWYFLAASQPWSAKRFDKAVLGESFRRTFDTLANTYRILQLYANLEGWAPSDADPALLDRGALDRWMLSRLASATEKVTAALEAYDLTGAARAIGDLVVDDVSNWYVRRSRDRFWGSADALDTRAAFRTLFETLVGVSRLLAPFTPFVADWLHRALNGGETVHLAGWPAPAGSDAALEAEMDAARTLSSLGRAARESIQVRVRQPLRAVHVTLPKGVALREEVTDLLRAELNVKEVHPVDDATDFVTLAAKPDFRALGPRFGKRTNDVAGAARSASAEALAGFRESGELVVELDGESVTLGAAEVELQQHAREGFAVETDGVLTAALDPTLDEKLELEGLARELVSRIQRLRKESGLEVQHRIDLSVRAEGRVARSVQAHRAFIMDETLAVSLGEEDLVPGDQPAGSVQLELDGDAVMIGLVVSVR